MVYVGRDGTISQNQPWSLNRLWGLILGFFSAIYLLWVKTFFNLVNLFTMFLFIVFLKFHHIICGFNSKQKWQ